MNARDLMKAILDMLTRSGKVPTNYTGEVTVTLNLSQGGVQDARLLTAERIK